MVLHSRSKAKGTNCSFHPPCPYQVSPQKLLFLHARFRQRLQLIHRTCWGSSLRCPGPSQQVTRSGGCRERAPEPPTSPACSQKHWCSSVGARWHFSLDYPIGLTAAPGQEQAPGQGKSPPVSHARLPTHLSSSRMPRPPHQLRDIYFFFFNPGASVRANRNGKSADEFRGSTKKRGEGRQQPTACF